MQEFNPILLLLVLVVSVLCGAGSFLHQRRTQRQKEEGWLLELLTELILACTAGLAALFLGWWKEFPFPLTCLVAVVASSNGVAFKELSKNKIINFFKNGGKNG